jgi:hypothetical protein
MESLLAKMDSFQEEMKAKTEANKNKSEVLRENMRTSQVEMKTQIGVLTSQMDIQLSKDRGHPRINESQDEHTSTLMSTKKR